MPSPTPSVYFVLGTPGSGRRGIVRDLIENGLAATDRAVVLLAGGEAADPADARLAALRNVEIRRWRWDGETLPEIDLPVGATTFFLSDAFSSPIDQLEALKPWLASQGLALARIFTVVDCQLAEKQPVLRQWFDACIHFSDVVFLTRREGVANKWLSDFVRHYKDEFYPCHFVQVKAKGDLPTPLVWLDPVARRVSQYFHPSRRQGWDLKFNALVDAGKQIVVSADKSPSDLNGLEDRLRTRLGCGIVADIHATTFELRLSILVAKANAAVVKAASVAAVAKAVSAAPTAMVAAVKAVVAAAATDRWRPHGR